MEKTVEEYIERLKNGEIYYKDIPTRVLMKYPDISIYIVREYKDNLAGIPENVIFEHPQIAIESVKAYPEALEYVPEEIKLANPQMCLDAVNNDSFLLKYVPEEIKLANPQMCLDAVKRSRLISSLLEYVPKQIMLDNIEICLEELSKRPEALEYIPEEIKLANPQMCLDAVKRNRLISSSLLEYVPKQIMLDNIEICLEELSKRPEALCFVPEEIKLANPQICIELVKKDAHLLEYVPDKIKLANPQMCIDAIKKNEYMIKYTPKEILINNSEMCINLLSKKPYLIEYMPKKILIDNPELVKKAIKYSYDLIKYVPDDFYIKHTDIAIEFIEKSKIKYENLSEKVLLENPQISIRLMEKEIIDFEDIPQNVLTINPEIYINAFYLKKIDIEKIPKEIIEKPNILKEILNISPDAVMYIPKEAFVKNPQIVVALVKEDARNLMYMPKQVMLDNQQVCVDAIYEEKYLFKYLPEELKLNNPKLCIDLIKENPEMLEYIPSQVMLDNKQECVNVVSENMNLLKYLPKKIMLENPDLCIDAVYNFHHLLEFIPDEVILDNSDMCLDIVDMEPNLFSKLSDKIKFEIPEVCALALAGDIRNIKYIPENLIEQKPEIFWSALNYNEYVYKVIPKELLKKDRKFDEYMFGEDLERFYVLREKGNYNLSVKENSIEDMNIFYHQMIKTIGIEEVEKLVEVPSFTREQIEEYQLQYDEKFNELFDKKYILTGDTEALVKIFNSIDLRGYEIKGKNVKFEVFKNINKILEEENDINLDELVNRAIVDSGLEVDSKVIEKLSSNKKAIANSLADQRFDKVRSELLEKLDAGLTSQQPVVSRIIESKIKASMVDNDGRINIDDVLSKIEDELNRTRENGGSFYSPHVLHQREQIKNIATEFLTDKNIEKRLSKSLVTIMKEKKAEIGKGWIRKVQSIPLNLSREEYEKLEERLGIKLDATYKTILRDGVDEKEAYKLLAECQIPGVVTFNQVETMFSSMRKPYSEEFKNFYKKNKSEILSRPEVYTRLSQIHNEFDHIINKPGVINRYNAGEVTLDDFIRMLDERKYEDIRDGNERLANKASEAGLTQDEFDEAQRVFEITSKREGTSIPQVNVKGKKFRGRMLRADDAINLFAGNMTTCCQRFGDVGEGAMLHGSTEKNGGIFVVEELDETGKVKKVVGQSWTWRNKDRVCFDNIEISNVEHRNLSEEDEKEIMDIYITAGKNAIETDQKVMDKLLKAGKISQQVYDAVVLKDVTVGLNQYNDLGELQKRIEDGTLKDVKEIVLPKEAQKTYRGINNNRPWIDSSERQIVLAKMDDKKREKIEKRIQKESKKTNEEIEYDEPVVYKNAREVDELVGENIVTRDIEKIKKIERVVYREGQQVLQDCEDIVDVASKYDMDEDKIEITMSKDGDWYMIGEEYDNEYYIADLAMVGGVNSQSNEKIDYNAKIATFEIAEKMYEKMIEMGKKEKNIRYEATRDTSYVNTLRMTEKGLGEIVQDEEDRFNGTEIEMNNVVLKPNVEKLEEELKKIREILSKVRKREQQKVVEVKKEDVDDISI